MRHRALPVCLSFAAVLALLASLVTPTWSEGEAAMPRIGLVHVKQVFSEYEAAKQFEAQMQAEKGAAQKEVDEIEKKMKDLMTEIQILPQGNALREQKEEELLQLDTLRKFRSERWKAVTLQRINENTTRIYNAIREEIDLYAQENGFALVLKTESPRLEEASTESANKRVNMRGVLYGAPQWDITSAIVSRLNAKLGR